jgi:hypothetical protein
MTKTAMAIAALAAVCSTAAFAGPVTEQESKYCAYDYRQYCGQDGLGSQLLALCMSQHGKELSKECIQALVDAGEVSEAEVKEREKSGQ